MGDKRISSGQIAWCASFALAAAAHLLLLWSTPTTLSARNPKTASAIEWQVLSQAAPTQPQPTNAESVSVQAPRPTAAARVATTSSKQKPTPRQLNEQPANEAAAESGNATAPDSLAAASGAAHEAAPARGGLAAVSSKLSAALIARAPQLLAKRDPCAGYFPATAATNRGDVQLAVDVDAQGHARAREILLEAPRGQGFEGAARACASQLHFAPALDAEGRPVSGHARIALRFHRS